MTPTGGTQQSWDLPAHFHLNGGCSPCPVSWGHRRGPQKEERSKASHAPALPSRIGVTGWGTALHSAAEMGKKMLQQLHASPTKPNQPHRLGQKTQHSLPASRTPVMGKSSSFSQHRPPVTLALYRGSVTPKHHPSALFCRATAITALHSPATTGAGEHTDTNLQLLPFPFPALFPLYSQSGIPTGWSCRGDAAVCGWYGHTSS